MPFNSFEQFFILPKSVRRIDFSDTYLTPMPETTQDIKDSEIHANHVEAYNASLRQNNSAFHRKTNTYAKQQRIYKEL